VRYAFETLRNLEKTYGEAFYILDVERFVGNYRELLAAFREAYPKTVIAYSYKTNYIPRLCKAADDLGGYAEVVSDMEYNLARRIGVPCEKIVFNGPYKHSGAVRELLLNGGAVHLDSLRELDLLHAIAREYPDRRLNVGIRVNFPVGDGVVSRFGFDARGGEFRTALEGVKKYDNIRFRTLHCHFAPRAIETWTARAEGMMKLIAEHGLRPECVDLGGGMYGKMDERLMRQFDEEIPTYRDYASAVGEVFGKYLNADYRPTLMLEPGSALAGDCMDLIAKVHSVKSVRGQRIATVLASTHNLHMGSKTPAADVVAPNGQERAGETTQIAGYTCIENDYPVRDFPGPIAEGDYVVFRNVGSYSVVLKPPFILPDFPVLTLDEGGKAEIVKRAETDRDIFRAYFDAEVSGNQR
jgi:diaminopimelate decarboxylase